MPEVRNRKSDAQKVAAADRSDVPAVWQKGGQRCQKIEVQKIEAQKVDIGQLKFPISDS